MPPFQYDPVSSRPWAQSIAELLAQNPQAAAAARSGAIYGRAIQQTGQDITGSLARELDPTTQLQRQALTDVHDQRTIAKETAARAQGEKLRATVADLAFDAKDGSEFVQRLDVLASDPTTGIPKQVVAHVQDLIAAGHWPEIQKSYLPFSPRYQTEQAELRKPMTVGEGGVVNTPQRATEGLPPLIQGAPKPPTKAGLGLKAAQGDPEAQKALDLLTPAKNPPSLEEQYLTAVSKGDKSTAGMILKSIAETANAKRDPAMQAMAKELAGLRGDEARARLEALQKKNAPLDVSPDVQTTRAGRAYIDLSSYQGDERNKAREAASAAGAVGVSKEQANALQEIDNARANQRDILNQIGDLLPKDAAGRLVAAPVTKLEKVFQTDAQKAAFASWRTAAIQTLRATAGSKGLRINQAEIAQAIENDIPRLTDTYATAQQKVKNIESMLENAEKSILVRDRSQDAAAPKEGTEGAVNGVPAVWKTVNGKAGWYKK